MILQAMSRYYQILAADSKILFPSFGYSVEKVRYVVVLSQEGDLISLLPVYEERSRGKKIIEISRPMIVPENVDRSSDVSPNFLYDMCPYIFGIGPKDKKAEYALSRFLQFREHNTNLLKKASCPAAKALLEFFQKYDLETIKAHPLIQQNLVDISKPGNFVFQIFGDTGFVHEESELCKIWDDFVKERSSKYIAQCLVTGEKAPIEKLHKKIKGLGSGTPIPLVSFDQDSPAYVSFGREGGFNAPVSEEAVFQYAATLNYLLSNENKSPRLSIGNTRVVYWAESQNPQYVQRFADLWGFIPEEEGEGEQITQHDIEEQILLDETAKKIDQVKNIDLQAILANLDADTKFYILGLEANKGRIVIRFFYSDPFVKIIRRIIEHYQALEITNEKGYPAKSISVWKIVDETVPQSVRENRRERIEPQLPAALLRSVFQGTPYPVTLYQSIINRVRSEIDKPKTEKEPGFDRVNYTRASIIKACLIRKTRSPGQSIKQEDITVSLNESLTNHAYLLGRLFAVLEKVQASALPDLNVTIKDRYFSSACTSPVLVFPRLVKLSQHHLSKLSKGSEIWFEKLIQGICAKLDPDINPYPSYMSLEDQGMFILGYYHQRADLFHSEPETVE